MARRILYVQYTSPAAYPPLEHSSQLLADEGWEALFLGISKPGDPPLHWPVRPGIRVRELPPSGPGWRRKLYYAWFCLWIVAWAVRWRPGWVYVSDALASPIGLVLSFWPGFKIVYHEHDTPTATTGLLLWMRRKLATRARARVLPNERRAETFNRTVANHRPTFSIWNCPTRLEVSPSRGPHRGNGLQVLYVGSVVPFRLPVSVIEALALLPDEVHLRVIGYATAGRSDYIDELRTRAQRLAVAHRTEFLDGMPHAQLLVASRQADVGLVLMPDATDDDTRQWLPGASNKPFDYLASGLALLVSNLPGWRDLLVEPGYGATCDAQDPHSIAEALRWFIDHPTEMRAMGERGRRRVDAEWNYETQFAPVRAWMNADCDSGSRSI